MSWWDELPQERRSLIASVLESAPRQLEVLKLRMDGHSYVTISRHLGITEKTVRVHLERALVKIGPHINRNEAA